MRRTWTIIGVRDVARSFHWYQSLLDLPPTAPAHDYFGQVRDTDDTVLICLHRWGAHEHPTLASAERAEPGNGLLLFFRVDDFDACLRRARELRRCYRSMCCFTRLCSADPTASVPTIPLCCRRCP
ncbi:MAG TPA: VOC family protein [Tahibacter sp.]|nr:VOC family protein [Tahibacter sp.]